MEWRPPDHAELEGDPPAVDGVVDHPQESQRAGDGEDQQERRAHDKSDKVTGVVAPDTHVEGQDLGAGAFRALARRDADEDGDGGLA